MIHDISQDGVKAVVPEYGCITLPLSELLQGRLACVFSLLHRDVIASAEN